MLLDNVKKHRKTHERKGKKVELPGFACRARLAETTESGKLLFQSRTNVLEEMSTATGNLQTNFS